MKKRKQNIIKDILKQARKESREAEIKAHGKPINRTKIQKSIKAYKRNKRVDLDE
ncbi:MAG: hypothetical protein GX102_09115 [Porphyromonadaceae bacterium]|nr:hypothetical protein [Porphyromonadaceae bacterium]